MMVNKKQLQEENEHWHKDHLAWTEEVDLWQNETKRLLALLFLLERALPAHTSMLKKHAALIESHEKQISKYECGVDEHCIPTCPSFITLEEQAEIHQTLSKLHEESRDEHLALKQTYSKEMEKFRSLALKLLDECE